MTPRERFAITTLAIKFCATRVDLSNAYTNRVGVNYRDSLRNAERRPVLCFFKRIEGGSVYQKKFLGRARLYILHSTAVSLPGIRVSRPRKHPRASRVASEWPSVFKTPFGPDQATCVTVRVDIHTS